MRPASCASVGTPNAVPSRSPMPDPASRIATGSLAGPRLRPRQRGAEVEAERRDGGGLVAGVRVDLRARGGRRHVVTHDVERLRRNAQPHQRAFGGGCDAGGQVAARVSQHQVVAAHVVEGAADLHALGGDGVHPDRELGLRHHVGADLHRLGDGRHAAGQRLPGAEERAGQQHHRLRRHRMLARERRPRLRALGACHAVDEGGLGGDGPAADRALEDERLGRPVLRVSNLGLADGACSRAPRRGPRW